jgi:RNA polymerase primary sigma factor
MEKVKEVLLKLIREKGYVDYDDVDELIRPYGLSDEQINELIVWINQNDFNVKTTEPIRYSDQYFTEISIYPLLSREEENQLAKKIREGDLLARDRFIKANLRLVVKQAKQFSSEVLTQYDLFQEGNIGLQKAVDHFDPNMNVPFASYSAYWIRKAIIEAINKAQMIRIPQPIYEQLAKINDVIEEYLTDNDERPDNAYIAEKLNLSVKKVEELLSYQVSIISLEEIFGQRRIPVSSSYVSQNDFLVHERLKALLGMLSERDRKIMVMYYGLGSDAPLTMQQIADKLSLSKQRVGQIIDSAKQYIRENYDK